MTDLEKHCRVVMDPVYGLVRLYEFELLVLNLKIVQRLRRLMQLQGACYLYPSAVHTRFSHSIGVVHVATLYADSIRNQEFTPKRKEVLRLAALLHDVAHGIFSHCYDEIVYSDIYGNPNDGHDQHRNKIVGTYMPSKVEKAFKELDPAKQTRIKEELSAWGFLTAGQEPNKEVFLNVFKEVADLWEGKGEKSVDFNILQGPIGADKIDYLLRDSYFAGNPFGKVDYERIIHFASVQKDESDELRLCYATKTFDSIVGFLLSKFLMYSSVYYHKTTRAADRMVKELLQMCKEPLGLVERTKDLQEFENLDEYKFFEEARLKVNPAKTFLDDLMHRRLLKVVDESPCPHDYSKSFIDPEAVRKAVDEKADQMIERIKANYKSKTGNELDKLLYKDTPFELKVITPDQLTSSNVYLYNPAEPKKVVEFDEAAEERGYQPFILSTLSWIRIYAREPDRLHLQEKGVAIRKDQSTDT